jgi:hypothetical protein
MMPGRVSAATAEGHLYLNAIIGIVDFHDVERSEVVTCRELLWQLVISSRFDT